uniref:Pantothenate synthetase n=1 Tax=uncultured Planctomycetota bacterium TaxID=120965 RepID=A0A1B0Z223_9BACT|nr:pantoate--beta-alanine ligase [uncultured Planctomycetota bacterium]
MRTTGSVTEVRELVAEARREGHRVGCVPTMGALHRGHTSLIQAAVADCDFVVVTLFVNGPQFNDPDDFLRYPRPLEDDLGTCQEKGVNVVFAPDQQTIYPAGGQTTVDVGHLGTLFEGQHRPGHFQGVATVVVKMLNITTPDTAFFGQKDFQQQLVIRHLCQDLHLPIDIVTCPTIRDDDGLALSSRNVLLAPEQRAIATSLSRVLRHAREQWQNGTNDLPALRQYLREQLESTPGLELDYATIVDANTFEETSVGNDPLVALVAASVGNIRLIDNLLLNTISEPG